MLILRNTCKSALLFFWIACTSMSICGATLKAEAEGLVDEELIDDEAIEKSCRRHKKQVYYLNTADFIQSFIEIPTSNVLVDSTTIGSSYLAGRAPLYNLNNEKVGVCSASFLCIQNADNIYTDISNYISVDNGLIISWLTPSTLANLELDSVVNSMVTECIVMASTKVGRNPYYGKVFNMVVSADNGRIYFKLYKL